jgi:hypothetical protein
MKPSRSERLRSAVKSPPLNLMLPPVGVIIFRIMRASVVFPLPDSPMIANTSGRSTGSEKLTSLTASKLCRPKTPPRA